MGRAVQLQHYILTWKRIKLPDLSWLAIVILETFPQVKIAGGQSHLCIS